MANTLTLEQLKSYKLLLAEGKISEFYTLMLDNGYAYAGWGRGVADGDTIAGLSALDFMTDSSMLGAVGPEARELSSEVIQDIKADMAQAYLDTLIAIADDSPTDTISRDIDAKEVREFHKEVFEDNGLSINNWTLNIPFIIVETFEGADGLERFWENLRDTGGEGLDAIWENMLVFSKMGLYGWDIFDGPTESMVEEWLSLVGFDGTFVPGIQGLLIEVSELFGGASKEVLLSRAMVEILFENVTLPSDGQEEQITSLVGLVNNPETARLYIDGIRALFLGAAASETPANDLNAMMASVAGVMADSNIPRDVTIESLANTTISQLQSGAVTSIGYRYALLHLNPFVVADANYDQHNTEGVLDLYNPDTGTGTMTDEWIKNRATFLVFELMYRASGDSDGSFEMPLGTPVPIPGDIQFIDYITGNSETPYELLVDGVDFGITPTKQIIFGSAGDDTFLGGDAEDSMFGGDGKDNIEKITRTAIKIS